MKKNKVFFLFILLFLVYLIGCDNTRIEENKLDAPSNIILSYNSETEMVKVSFEQVKNATTYQIFVYQNGNIYQSVKGIPGYEISNLPDGTYIIEVQAIDETNEYKESDISKEEKTVTINNVLKDKLSEPTNLSVVYIKEEDNVLITFTEVENAKTYMLYIYVNNQEVNKQEIKNLEKIKLEKGEYVFRVQAIGDNKSYIDSNLSNPSAKTYINYEIIDNKEILTSIMFKGLDNETVPYGSKYHILSNIRVVGNDGATYLTEIISSSSIPLNNDCIPIDYVGEVVFTYETNYLGLKAYGTKKINVLSPSGIQEGENLITNGDFNNDISGWIVSNHEGAASDISIVDGSIKIAIYSLNRSNASSPRLNSSNFTLENNTNYVVSFDAWSVDSKAIQVQIGELFDTSPYFTNYMGMDPQVFILDNEKQKFSFEFKYNETTSSNVTILFEMGIVTGITTITDVYIDNIQIKETNAPKNDLIVPAFTGIGNKTLYVGAKMSFNPLAGISAIDNVDGDLTKRIIYTIYDNNKIIDKINLEKTGTYQIHYLVSDNSYNTVKKICTIEVIDMPRNEGNLLINGDMENGLQNWQIVTHEGGFASQAVEEGMIKISMSGINWNDNPSSPRLNNFIPFNLISGESYKVSFDAKADETKTILVQIGELFEMAPYWQDLKPQTRQIYTLTNELNHYEFLFIHEKSNCKRGFITFEMGVVEEDKTITDVYFDNISIEHLTYELDDYISPLITGLSNHWFFSKEINYFDPLTNIKAVDDIDGDLTDKLTYRIYKNDSIVDVIDYNIEGDYEIEYKITDNSGNETIKRIKVIILPEISKLSNIMVDINWKKNEEGVSEFNIEQISEGIKFIMSEDGGKNTWDVRAVSNTFNLTSGSEYTIYFDLNSVEERDIFVQVGNYDNTSYFQVQYSKILKISKEKTRYMINFIANANGSFALGFEMGPGSTYPYIQTIIEATNFVMIKGKTYLQTPTGVVLNKISQGTILAFAAMYTGDVKFLLYVYKNNELISGAPFNIINGQNLDLLDIPKGTYTIKIQAIGVTDDVIPSELSDSYTYIK